MRSALSVLLALVLLLPACWGQQPYARQLTLPDLTDRAATIVHGVVEDARTEPLKGFPNIKVAKVTVKVIESLYGTTEKRITYRMFMPPSIGANVHAKSYRVGQEVILFMHGPSQYGLTSPVGGEQGLFRVLRDDRNARVVNGLNNAGLFRGITEKARLQKRQMTMAEQSLAQHEDGAVQIDDFVGAVRQLAATRGTK